MAPARNVSPAAMTLESPCLRSHPASFATVVVLPVPLTPTNRITYGLGVCSRTALARSSGGRARIARQERSRQVRIASSASTPNRSFLPARSRRRSRRNRSITGTATSDSIRTISRSSSTSSMVPSFSRRPRNPSVKIVSSPAVDEGPGAAGAGEVDDPRAWDFGGSRELSEGVGDASSERLSLALIAAHIGRRAVLPRDRVESLRECLDSFVERTHLPFEVPQGLVDADRSFREELDHLRSFHLDDDPRADPHEYGGASIHGTSHERLSPEREQELHAGGRPVDALEALAGTAVVLTRCAQDLMLLEQGVQLVAVGVESHEVLLDLLFGRSGRGGAHAAVTSPTEVIRIRERFT